MNQDKSYANGNGNSVAGGPSAPVWLRHDWQYAETRASQYSSWTVGPA
jgi:hypothetical protein